MRHGLNVILLLRKKKGFAGLLQRSFNFSPNNIEVPADGGSGHPHRDKRDMRNCLHLKLHRSVHYGGLAEINYLDTSLQKHPHRSINECPAVRWSRLPPLHTRAPSNLRISLLRR
jgi:hypothetical protein